MSEDPAYLHYWRRKQLLAGSVPAFPVRRWWKSDECSESEQVMYEAIRHSSSLLDVGAGDLRMQRKFQKAGYAGEYHTQDIGDEYAYTYRVLAEVIRTYGAVLCLDVIEHLPLRQGLEMLQRLVELLAPGGVLVVQTPNARCLPHPLSLDMTHMHCYNAGDLWAYLSCLNLKVDAYRVSFGPPRRSLLATVRFALTAFVTTRIIGCDYAENILLIGRKPAPVR